MLSRYVFVFIDSLEPKLHINIVEERGAESLYSINRSPYHADT